MLIINATLFTVAFFGFVFGIVPFVILLVDGIKSKLINKYLVNTQVIKG